MTLEQHIRGMSKAAHGAAGAIFELAETLGDAPPDDERSNDLAADKGLMESLMQYTMRLDTLTHAVDTLTATILAKGPRV